MTAVNGQLVTKVREALDTARRAGQPVPGRPTRVRITGATDHAVRKALAKLADEPTNSGGAVEQPAPAGERPTVVRTGGGRVVAWTGFVFGSVMSVAANVLHTWSPAPRQEAGWSPAVAAQIGAAVWPIGLLLSIEVLSHVRWSQGWHRAFVRHRYRIGAIGLTDAETAELYNLAEVVTR
jgi:hypothetical protein